MDVKKLAGLLAACALAVPIIASAPPGTLALLDVGLVGLLYVIRRQRSVQRVSSYRKAGATRSPAHL